MYVILKKERIAKPLKRLFNLSFKMGTCHCKIKNCLSTTTV